MVNLFHSMTIIRYPCRAVDILSFKPRADNSEISSTTERQHPLWVLIRCTRAVIAYYWLKANTRSTGQNHAGLWTSDWSKGCFGRCLHSPSTYVLVKLCLTLLLLLHCFFYFAVSLNEPFNSVVFYTRHYYTSVKLLTTLKITTKMS